MNRNDQEFLVQKIRTEYTEKEHTQLDELKALDTKVKRPVERPSKNGVSFNLPSHIVNCKI